MFLYFSVIFWDFSILSIAYSAICFERIILNIGILPVMIYVYIYIYIIKFNLHDLQNNHTFEGSGKLGDFMKLHRKWKSPAKLKLILGENV